MDDKAFRAQFPALIRNFANYKDVVQGCSKKTVTEYLFDLRTFCRYLCAARNGLPTSGEEFEAIDISSLDTAFFESVTASEVYDFLTFVKGGEGSRRQNQGNDVLSHARPSPGASPPAALRTRTAHC